ncbi:hypothetical protein ACJ41O_011766 [Fusarium nematophilum]
MTDNRPNIYAAVGVTFPLATVSLVLRLLARRMTKASYGVDDVLAVVSYFASVAYTTVALVWTVNFGLGRPIADGPPNLTEDERLEKSWLMLWLTSFTYSFAIAFAKFAILAFYWRVFKFSDIRVPIQALAALTVAWFLLRLFMVTLQCVPINALWDKSVEDAECNIHEATFFFSTVLTHVLIDCAILALPAIEVGKLHLPKGQKVAVIALFMFGALVCLASIFVLIESFRFDSHTKEIGLEMGIHDAWATVEVNLAVVSACLPMLRPIFRRILPRSFLTSHSGGQSGQYPQSGKTASNPFSRNTGATGGPFSSKTKGIKLTTIAKTGDDGSSSTHELANSGPEAGGPSDFEPLRPDWGHGTHTVISSPWRKYASARDADDYDQGIYVQNETAVQVDRRV